MSVIDIQKETSLQGSLIRFATRFWAGLARLSESTIALIGLILFMIVVFMAITAPWLATHDPLEMDFLALNATASADHWMGSAN